MNFTVPIVVRQLQLGDIWQEWDVWNTVDGLERIPFRKVGQPIRFVRPRDIFLRPLSAPHDLTQKEWERFIRSNHQ